MTNALVISVFVASLSVDYLVHERGFLPYLILLPELLSAIATVVVVARLMAGARLPLDGRYTVFLIGLLITIVLGFVIQGEPTGPIIAGIRAHLKFAPFFLLPMVFPFSAKQLRTQFLVLMTMLVFQAPLALYQRFVEYAHLMQTGDPVRGTATTSSALSMLLMCAMAAVVSLYLRGKIRLGVLFVLAALLFLPTTLNETKATFLLLPVAVIAPALFMPRGSRTAGRLLPLALLGSLAMVVFIGVYDYFIQFTTTHQEPIGEFFGDSSYLHYLYSGAAERGANYIGRFDSLEFALKGITRDPLTAAFGLGAGNVSPSFLPQFDGQYSGYFDLYGVGMTQVTNLLWQVGFVGLLIYLLFYYFVLNDSRTLARTSGDNALLGQIWVSVTLIMIFALIYKSIFAMNEIGYPLWFYSGVVAARVAELRRARRARRARSVRNAIAADNTLGAVALDSTG